MKNDKIIKIIRVAKKYYESHMDQKIIAKEEGISVSTVSRMLKRAEELGYIKISVEYPVLSNEELSESLQKKYKLKNKLKTDYTVESRKKIIEREDIHDDKKKVRFYFNNIRRFIYHTGNAG